MTKKYILGLKEKVTKHLNAKLKGLKDGTIILPELTSVDLNLLTERKGVASDQFEEANNPQQFMGLLSRFQEEIDELPPHSQGEYNYEPMSPYDDDYIEDNCIYYTYTSIRDTITTNIITIEVERRISEGLRPPRASTLKTPYWHDVQDYLDGVKTLEELVSRTYPIPNTISTRLSNTPRRFSWR